MSPLEFGRALAAYDADCRERFEAQVSQAWYGVSLYAEMASKGTLPALADVLARMKPKPIERPQAVAQVKSDLMFLSKSLGIPLRPISPEAEAAFVRVDGR